MSRYHAGKCKECGNQSEYLNALDFCGSCIIKWTISTELLQLELVPPAAVSAFMPKQGSGRSP